MSVISTASSAPPTTRTPIPRNLTARNPTARTWASSSSAMTTPTTPTSPASTAVATTAVATIGRIRPKLRVRELACGAGYLAFGHARAAGYLARRTTGSPTNCRGVTGAESARRRELHAPANVRCLTLTNRDRRPPTVSAP